jgi:hypothetical protein
LQYLFPALAQLGKKTVEQRHEQFLKVVKDRLRIRLEQGIDRLVSVRLQLFADLVREELIEGCSHQRLDHLLRIGAQALTASAIRNELNWGAGYELK